MKKKDNKGFTLIEVLIVIAIIGILFAVLVPRINVGGDKAKEAGVKTDFRSYEIAVEQVMVENSGLPKVAEKDAILEINKVLDEEMKLETTSSKTKKPDPWKHEYEYEKFGVFGETGTTGHGIAIRSFGKNGKADNFKGDGSGDDFVIVIHYTEKGTVKTCTQGLSNDIGKGVVGDWGSITGCKDSVTPPVTPPVTP